MRKQNRDVVSLMAGRRQLGNVSSPKNEWRCELCRRGGGGRRVSRGSRATNGTETLTHKHLPVLVPYVCTGMQKQKATKITTTCTWYWTRDEKPDNCEGSVHV
jgi:hypothetical protein